MDLELTEDQRMIQEAVRRFADERVKPNAYDWDKASRCDPSVLREAAELGLLGIAAPEDVGGSGLGYITASLAIEEVARHDGALGASLALHNSAVVANAAALPDGDVRERWAAALVSGEARGAFVEGIDASADGDAVRLDGTAKFVPLAATADVLFVAAGDRVAVVEASKVERHATTNLLGLRATDSATVTFEAVSAPAFAIGASANVATTTLMAAVAVGVARGCLEEARAYSLERKQFKKPIAQFQAIQWMLADMATEIDAARMLIHFAAHTIDRGDDAECLAAEARLFATESAVRAGMSAVQIYGGNGFVREFPVERYLRDAKTLAVCDGTVDRQRDVIAGSVLA